MFSLRYFYSTMTSFYYVSQLSLTEAKLHSESVMFNIFSFCVCGLMINQQQAGYLSHMTHCAEEVRRRVV